MLRRIAVSLPALSAATTAARFYTPPADLQKLYASDFDKSAFPVNLVPSDSVLFAQFLYKAAEPKKAYEAILKDFQTIASAVPKLPVFWERTCQIGEVKEFSGLSPATIFTLEWMQSNGMLELLPDVADVYETYVNAKLKRVVAKVYVAPGQVADQAAAKEALKIAEGIVKQHKELEGFKLTHKMLVDRSIVEGFAVEIHGNYVNNAKGRQVAAAAADESDFINIPAPRLPKTKFEDNVESEVLAKYLESLAQYDAEELRNGV